MPNESQRNRYAEIFELAPIARVITDRFGVIREGNRAATELLVGSSGALVDKPLAMFVAPEDRSQFRQRLLDVAETTIPTTWVMWLRPRHRSAFRGELHVVGSETDPGHLHWAISDVTERMAMEEELRLLAAELDEGVVVAVLADAGWKYLSAPFWEAREDRAAASMEASVWW